MIVSSLTTTVPYVVCAVAYAVLVALVVVPARRSRTGLLLAAAAGATALWAAGMALEARGGSGGPVAMLDLLHLLAWFGFGLHLYRREPAARGTSLFSAVGLLSTLGVITLLLGRASLGGIASGGALSLSSPAIAAHLALAIGQLLLLENLYRSTPPQRRWHIGPACIALGALAGYDIVVCADAVLPSGASPALVAGRPLVAALVTPLFALAAARNRHWRIDIHVSRIAAFHTATLVICGVFLLALATAGELAARFGAGFGVGWGGLAQVCLLFAGVITVAMLLTSGTARGALRRGVVDHFFTHRYDYRREWQRCLDTLAAVEAGPLGERAIRALATAVDSPSGLLFLREPGHAGLDWAALDWAGAWNTRAAGPLAEAGARAILTADGPLLLDARLLSALSDRGLEPPFDTSFAPWLVVPLRESDSRVVRSIGCVLLARPHAAFRLDAEVFDLLRVLAHEVAVHLARQRAASVLLQTRELRAYGERFAFVAHDIKNVASQLTLLLSNAETHLADPEFQLDMLATVRASVGRIGGLIRRLEPTQAGAAPRPLDLVSVLSDVLAGRPPDRGAAPSARMSFDVEPAAQGARIAMEGTAFAATVTHLLDNALTAAGGAGSVRVALRATPARVLLDIADDGPGMTPQFVRDELFRPFATRTPGGSGIGAFQARELLRAAGGDLTVLSRPRPEPRSGTTMRLSWPRASVPDAALCATLVAA